MNTPTCPKCGAQLDPKAPEGLCPGCMLKASLESGDSKSDPRYAETSPNGPELTIEALAGDLPNLEILEAIGHGGMGVVYRARQRSLDRVVALKVLSSRMRERPGFEERFTREARALARLSHQNIVTLHDFGQANGRFYLVMEYVEGINLRQALKQGRLAPAEALQIVPKLCDALQYAHEHGVVHRDIKPENILIDEHGHVKIADFGLAKLVDPGMKDPALTGTRDVMGTPNYMAPEQIDHPAEVDHRADIYALGVVLYEMLTGELPLGRFALPSSRVHVDVRLDEIVLRTLEREPQRRYQSADAVKSDIESVPVPKAPRDAPRRRMSLAAVVAVVAAIGVVAMGGLLGLQAYRNANRPAHVPATSTITLLGRIVDKIDLPFVDDPAVVGTWKSVDFVVDPAAFMPGKKQWPEDLFLKELTFHPAGFMNRHRATWTKGIVISSADKTASSYTVKDIDGSTYMFFEWKSGDYVFRREKPSYYVLKKEAPAAQATAERSQPARESVLAGCIEAAYDNGRSDGKQSYGGRGPAIHFRPRDFLGKNASSWSYVLKGIRIYGSRYGVGYSPKEAMINISILGPDGKMLAGEQVPYSLFGFKEKWVDVVLTEPVPITHLTRDGLMFRFDPDAHQTKGIYFHYNKRSPMNGENTHSLAGSGEDFARVPDREWMIRAYFAPSGGSNDTAASQDKEPPSIVATSPRPGTTDVDPVTSEITVTFDRDMLGGYSWTGGGPYYPPSPDKPGPGVDSPFWRDKRTCVLPVKLQEGRYYRIGINGGSCGGFRSSDGVSALPSAIYFTTRGASEELKQKVLSPTVTGMEPANGARDIDPGVSELRVTFNVPMGDGCSWVGGGEHYPDSPEGKRVYWTADKKTCVLPVTLKPNWSYQLYLNSPQFTNFTSEAGVALAPVTYTFSTGAAREATSPEEKLRARALEIQAAHFPEAVCEAMVELRDRAQRDLDPTGTLRVNVPNAAVVTTSGEYWTCLSLSHKGPDTPFRSEVRLGNTDADLMAVISESGRVLQHRVEATKPSRSGMYTVYVTSDIPWKEGRPQLFYWLMFRDMVHADNGRFSVKLQNLMGPEGIQPLMLLLPAGWSIEKMSEPEHAKRTVSNGATLYLWQKHVKAGEDYRVDLVLQPPPAAAKAPAPSGEGSGRPD